MKKLVLLLLAFNLTACMKVRGKDDKGDAAAQVSNLSLEDLAVVYSNEQQGPIKLLLQDSGQPGFYTYAFTWDRDLSDLYVEVNSSEVISLALGTRHFSKLLEHNQPYSFEFYQHSRGGKKIVSSFRGQSPRDIIVSKDLSLQKETGLEAFRVFVAEGVAITTNGNKLQVRSRELTFSTGSVIQTFPKGAKAQLDKAGRDGGVIQINSDRIMGEVEFAFRGEHGGDGSPAKEHTDRAAQGSPEASPRMKNIMGDQICVGTGVPAGPGANGADGFPGNNGKSGGNTGYLILMTQNIDRLKYSFVSEVGVAGVPTNGGKGQLGGLAGKLGRGICSAHGKPGGAGKDGKPGPAGVREKDGEKQNSCLSVNGSNVQCY